MVNKEGIRNIILIAVAVIIAVVIIHMLGLFSGISTSLSIPNTLTTTIPSNTSALPKVVTSSIPNTLTTTIPSNTSALPKVVNTIATGPNTTPVDIAISPNGAFAYVSLSMSNYVSVINTRTNTVTNNISVGNGPTSIVFAPTGDYAYVTNTRSDTVSVINTTTNKVIATISVGSEPINIAITPNGKYVFVDYLDSAVVSVINTTLNIVVNTITGPPNTYLITGYSYIRLHNIAVNPLGNPAYIGFGEGIFVINTNNFTTSIIPYTSIPGYWTESQDAFVTDGLSIAFAPNGDYAYVTNPVTNNTFVINTITGKSIIAIQVGTYPEGVAINPVNGYIYVANYGNDSISVINNATDTVTNNISVGFNPSSIAITPNGDYAYVTNTNSDTISVIYIG
ncbi:YncE family protein [Candidatus Marsarchaeota archaeon]|nr:YncE family protein [Candidatus Marsarchaeota archaeon]